MIHFNYFKIRTFVCNLCSDLPKRKIQRQFAAVQWWNRKFRIYQAWIHVEGKVNIVVSGNPSFLFSLPPRSQTQPKNEKLHAQQ